METRRKLLPSQIEVMDDEMAKVIRKKTGAERLQIASDMFDSARELIVCYLRSQHPDWDEDEVQFHTSNRISHGVVTREIWEHGKAAKRRVAAENSLTASPQTFPESS